MKLWPIILSLTLGASSQILAQTQESIDEIVYKEFKSQFNNEVPAFLNDLRENNLRTFYDFWKKDNLDLYSKGINKVIIQLLEEIPSEHWGTVTYNGELPNAGWSAVIQDSNTVVLGEMAGGIIINEGQAWYDIFASSDDLGTPDDEGAVNGETTFPFINDFATDQSLVHSVASNNRTDLTITTTRIVQDLNNIPEQYMLSQNYPNPFNSSTKINFYIPEDTHVNITIYNVLGQTVASIVNEHLNQGKYRVDWKPENIHSGLYFYRLETKEFVKTKKMNLIK